MIVKNNRLGLTGIGYDEATKKCAVVLVPGPNEVSVEAWAKAADHPIVKTWLEDGTLEVFGEDKPTKAPEDILVELHHKSAEKTARETIDIKLLKKWHAKEKREKVKKAIEKQIEELSAPPEYRDSSGVKESEGEGIFK